LSFLKNILSTSIVKEELLTDDDRLSILARAQELGLVGAGGACGDTAMAINELLFGGKGEIVAAVNKYLYRYQYRAVGHFGVRVGDQIWDYEGAFDGPEGLEEFMAWGMLDPEDPDYGFWTEEDAHEVELVEGWTARDMKEFGHCGLTSPRLLLLQAVREHTAVGRDQFHRKDSRGCSSNVLRDRNLSSVGPQFKSG
jgi:hypothetical protein